MVLFCNSRRYQFDFYLIVIDVNQVDSKTVAFKIIRFLGLRNNRKKQDTKSKEGMFFHKANSVVNDYEN